MIERIRKYRDRKFNTGSYLVYSMGKVGSSSVYDSLKMRLPHSVVFHTHFLSDEWLDNILPQQKSFFHGNIHIGKKIRKYLDDNAGKKIRIITLVREPVIREMSGIFENWKAHFDDISKVSLEEMKNKIDQSNFSFCLDWFDSEFKNYTGIDIYDIPFNKDLGYQIYHIGDFEILCIQLEKLKEVFSKAMNEFMGLKINLITSNVGENKLGSELYAKLKNSYKLPSETSDLVYNSKYVRHFYSEKDVVGFKNKWKG